MTIKLFVFFRAARNFFTKPEKRDEDKKTLRQPNYQENMINYSKDKANKMREENLREKCFENYE